ncbi:Uncharacterised protein [Cedecea lapagei]|uniref:Uncharacterized protein n=1 Tax=Cedecea lapagei TaxID=158823 RepID=A0A447V344_9ENTR|nr:Uncharacterised protein [Cedecea lapagei]
MMLTGKQNRFFQRLKACLTEQNGPLTPRRPLNNGFWRDTAFRHQGLNAIDIQRSWREMIDMAAAETNHIGNQTVLFAQGAVGFSIYRGVLMPAEGFQCFSNEDISLRFAKPSLLLMKVEHCPAAGVKISR